jgi:hypothetical protein
MLKVNNIIVNGKTIANQYIMHNCDNLYIFQSYKSIIAEVDLDKAEIVIYLNYDLSRTTSKYRNKFFSGLGFDEIATTEGLRKAIKDGGFTGYKVIYKNVNP